MIAQSEVMHSLPQDQEEWFEPQGASEPSLVDGKENIGHWKEFRASPQPQAFTFQQLLDLTPVLSSYNIFYQDSHAELRAEKTILLVRHIGTLDLIIPNSRNENSFMLYLVGLDHYPFSLKHLNSSLALLILSRSPHNEQGGLSFFFFSSLSTGSLDLTRSNFIPLSIPIEAIFEQLLSGTIAQVVRNIQRGTSKCAKGSSPLPCSVSE